MTTVQHAASTSITDAGATPPTAHNTGNGAAGYLKEVSDSLVVVAQASADTTLRFVRVPSNAKVKAVILQSQAQTAGSVDVGVYYPTFGPTAKADLAANAIDQDFFATAVDLSSAVQPTDITNESGTYTADKQNQPLWQAVGLTSDPGGFLDIVATVKTTAVTTGLGIAGISVRFVE